MFVVNRLLTIFQLHKRMDKEGINEEDHAQGGGIDGGNLEEDDASTTSNVSACWFTYVCQANTRQY